MSRDEQQVRRALQRDAQRIHASALLRERVGDRIRGPRRGSRQVAVAVGLAVFLAIALVAATLIGRGPEVTDVIGPPSDEDYFPAFWPATTWQEAYEIQARVDAGEDEWRTSPEEVTTAFIREFVVDRWRLEWDEFEVDGTTRAGNTATVTFRPHTEDARRPFPLHTVHLVALEEPDEPAWYVTGVTNETTGVRTPSSHSEIVSPLLIDAAVGTSPHPFLYVADDTGNVLATTQWGGSGSPQSQVIDVPQVRAYLPFEKATTPAGVVVFQGGQGLEPSFEAGWAPINALTVVRVRFDPAPPEDYFPGFWPTTSRVETEQIQARVDAAEEGWRRSPERVAEAFAREFLEWDVPEAQVLHWSMSPGWRTASVRLHPRVGETQEGAVRGPEHIVQLVAPPGSDESVWFVASIASENLVLIEPSNDDGISSPMRVRGSGRAYEGNVIVEVLDDDRRVLHSANIQAGAMEPQPFEAELELDDPGTDAGILVLKADTGIDGPHPDYTIVRIRFGG